MTNSSSEDSQHDNPPFFKNWWGMYALVLGFLAFLVSLFYYLTTHFS